LASWKNKFALKAIIMKTVIITGSDGNLGTAVTKTFLEKGYQVVATIDSEAKKAAMPGHKNLDIQVADLSDEQASQQFIRYAVSTYQRVDGALLLAGGFAPGDIRAVSGSDLKKQITLNFETAFNVSRPLFQHMMEQQSGRIVFIGARPALVASQGKSAVAYGLSKSLLFKLAEYLNAEAKGTSVTTTVIVPSTLDTPLNRKSMPDADPAKWVKTADLAGILEFLISDLGTPLRETVLKVYNNA
jgi:NAD(P)-dependent dehydrogenase (short-subunit alcohol dehydrogenase family)